MILSQQFQQFLRGLSQSLEQIGLENLNPKNKSLQKFVLLAQGAFCNLLVANRFSDKNLRQTLTDELIFFHLCLVQTSMRSFKVSILLELDV